MSCDQGASRTEQLSIDAIEICPTCPRRGNCAGVARLAIDTYLKVSYFTISQIPGDPEAFVHRVYVDDEGGESEPFFDPGESRIWACKGPEVVKRKLIRPNIVDCGAFLTTRKELDALHAWREAQYAAERAQAVYLTPEETRVLSALPPAELRLLSELSTGELNKLILFCRNHPDETDDLKLFSGQV